MSSLNALEISLLTKAALNPRPKKSWADYKRSQRQKAAARTPEGCMLVSTENIQRSLIDAMADLMKSGNTEATIADLINSASNRFPIPEVAQIAIRQRLATRKSSRGGQSND